MSEIDELNNYDDERLIDIPAEEEAKIEPKVTVRYEKSANRVKVRKLQLFDKLNSHKLTYIKGGICDSFIKYGFPSLDEVIDNVQNTTELEDKRLEKLIRHLEKRQLQYDSRVSYYREYVEQGTNLRTAIREGRREWFLINKTCYQKILALYKDEERAEEEAINRYLKKEGYDREFQRHLGKRQEFEMKIRLY
jgi:hypothetical protein